jgi:hypothetical protein
MKSGVARKVTQYDLEGNEMLTYRSINEAAQETDSCASKISMCCQRQRETCHDYQWRYADDPNKDVKKLKRKFITGKRVAQCDEEGNILAVYPSFREAARSVNGTSSAISRVCSGLNIRHKGYKWKIVEDIVQEE